MKDVKIIRQNGLFPRGNGPDHVRIAARIALCFIMTSLLSCRNPKRTDEQFPPPFEENNTLNTYEGRVPLNEDSSLYIQLSMHPSGVMGEGFYQLEEFVEANNSVAKTSSFTGKYSTLFGETPDERIVQFHLSAHPRGLKRTYLTQGFQGNITDSRLTMIREEPFRTTDLSVRIFTRYKLTVLGDRLETVSDEAEHNLVRRNSPLFTLEGYFRHNGDSADFHEINTGENWAVSKYGEYRKAIRQYHQLTTKKFDMTYLKGVGFSIRHIDKQGKEIDALVIRRVLQMTSMPDRE